MSQSLTPTPPASDHSTGYVRVAIPSPLRRLFDYLPPVNISAQEIGIGTRVQIPFGHRQLIGIVVSTHTETDIESDKLKSISKVLDHKPLIPRDIIELCHWAAKYYHHSFGDTLIQAIPKNLRSGKSSTSHSVRHWKLILPLEEALEALSKNAKKQRATLQYLANDSAAITEIELVEAGFSKAVLKQLANKETIQELLLTPARIHFSTIPHAIKNAPLTLNNEQSYACEAITEGLGHFKSYLLEGITGSGKTEVYLQAIAAALESGKQTLVLVPEIGLTPQTVSRFRHRFGIPVACLHSGLNDGERLQGWLEASRSTAGILIATRSGIFTPMPDLGLIIVDEEHDGSYKQQDSLRYNARDLAIYRARQVGCPIVLGSATPSLETISNARQGRYTQLYLKQRAGQSRPPVIELLDIRQQVLKDGLATSLIEQIAAHLGRGNQVMVFLNRRGYAPSMMCHDCGTVIDCPHCDAHMTIHRQPPHMHCHHCEYQTAIPWICPNCHSKKLQPSGQGTERTEQVLNNLFPHYPVLRVDRDSTRKKDAFGQILDKIQTGNPSILLGTQMLAKGHHFPNVTLVAIINADSGLFSADFRGLEKTGQLIMQVSGRAGRAHKPGHVIIQTHNPTHPSLQLLSLNDYGRFVDSLFVERKQLNLPPESYMALLRAESYNSGESEALLKGIRSMSDQISGQNTELHIRALGPIPAPMERRQGRYRWQLLIQSSSRNHLHNTVDTLVRFLEEKKLPKQLRWTIDIDPQEMS
ncbi:primosomal protein N' [Endozoicomonas sp. (ex Bugula neritina AB1)]|nr:primosomal protein N' [Endozoicomonas sp. (ex Bugula neritina AB1)]